jgi:beta-phosphoglucomutase-like phosphatase (HAD superfamily)
LLGIDFERVPVVTCDQITHGKPDPDLFLTAAERLAVDIETSSVVGDSVWDMLAARRARALEIGIWRLWPGRAGARGACRVYEDPADLLKNIDEVGGRG